MKSKLLATIFLLQSVLIFAGGLSAWTEDTPYGHEMYHDGTSDAIIMMSLDSTTVGFKHFYFYKGYTIAHSDSNYLIINEKTEKIQEFDNEKDWKAKLEEQNLVPFIKREYDSNYSSALPSGGFALLLFLPFPLVLPLLWLICLITIDSSNRKYYRFRSHFLWVYPALLILCLMIDSLPQSI